MEHHITLECGGMFSISAAEKPRAILHLVYPHVTCFYIFPSGKCSESWSITSAPNSTMLGAGRPMQDAPFTHGLPGLQLWGIFWSYVGDYFFLSIRLFSCSSYYLDIRPSVCYCHLHFLLLHFFFVHFTQLYLSSLFYFQFLLSYF